jgi:hypothetical protein
MKGIQADTKRKGIGSVSALIGKAVYSSPSPQVHFPSFPFVTWGEERRTGSPEKERSAR